MNRNICIFLLLAVSSLMVLQFLYSGADSSKKARRYAEYMREEPTLLSVDTFECHLESCPLPVVVNFSARWSEDGVAMDERFRELQKQHRRVSFCIVDIDDNPGLASTYNIHSVPQILYFCEGEKVKLETNDGSNAEAEPQVELLLMHCQQ